MATRNPHVVSVCPKARNPHVVSDCQPSNPPDPEPAGTNIHYPRTQHQRRVNFKFGEDVKHSVATGVFELGSVLVKVTTSRPLADHPVVTGIVSAYKHLAECNFARDCCAYIRLCMMTYTMTQCLKHSCYSCSL